MYSSWVHENIGGGFYLVFIFFWQEHDEDDEEWESAYDENDDDDDDMNGSDSLPDLLSQLAGDGRCQQITHLLHSLQLLAVQLSD